MTQQEAIEHYNIPASILQEYESWGLCGAVKKVMGVWQYDDEDLEWLSTILTLHDIGFTTEEAETYMRLLLEQADSTKKRLRMMKEKQNKTLGCINQAVKQLRVGGERLEFLAAHQQSRNPEVAELLGFFTVKVGEIDFCLHENNLNMRNFGNKKWTFTFSHKCPI